ncbi:phage tail protein [Microbulbifer sp. PSTR4-B]|uniref:phage tail protein n=1 Tax=unclassified Microbulbifer TaxID=2619833 RepID=UPI00403ACB59
MTGERITLELRGSDALETYITEVEQKLIPRAEARAANRTANHLRSRYVRDLSAKTRVRQKTLRRKVKQRHAKVGELAQVWFGLLPVPLAAIPGVRQVKAGVRGPGGIDEPGAFIAMVGAGHRGAFRRKTKKRLPIRQLTRAIDQPARQVLGNVADDQQLFEFFARNFNSDLAYMADREARKHGK